MAAASDAVENDLCAALPEPLAIRVFLAMPADARARCACVRRAWRAALAHSAAWQRLDMCDMACTLKDTALEAAAARAEDGLVALTVPGDLCYVSEAALLAVVEANRRTLRELRFVGPFWAEKQVLWNDAFVREHNELVHALLAAAPELEVLEAPFAGGVAEACRALRQETPYEALRIASLVLTSSDRTCTDANVRDMCALCARHVSLSRLLATRLRLGAPEFGALLHAVAPHLEQLLLFSCSLTPQCVPPLARLLTFGPKLRSLAIIHARSSE